MELIMCQITLEKIGQLALKYFKRKVLYFFPLIFFYYLFAYGENFSFLKHRHTLTNIIYICRINLKRNECFNF